MKRIIVLLCGTLLITSIGCSSHKAARTTAGSQTAYYMKKSVKKTYELQSWVYLPDNYNESAEPLPLMLFLHGAGERGDDLNKVKVHRPPMLADQGKDFPFIIVSPQCPEGNWWPNMLDELNYLLDDIISRYRVDTSRIYLTGLSMGGYGTWALAIDNPKRFAAIAPICGGSEPFFARRIKDVPTWVFHGRKDQTVPISESENMVEALKKLGADVRFTVYPDAGHNSWTESYNNPELYEWFLQHRKK